MNLSFFENNISLFFSLDRKEAKDQDCKKMTKNFTHSTTRNELSRNIHRNIECGIKQHFLFDVSFVHSFNIIFLRSWKNKKVII